MLDVPTAAIERDGRLTETRFALASVPPLAHAGDAVLERDDAELLGRASRDAGKPRPMIYVLQREYPAVIPRPDVRRAHRGRRTGHNRNCLSGRLPVIKRQQFTDSIGLHVIDAQGRIERAERRQVPLWTKRTEIVFLVERKGM